MEFFRIRKDIPFMRHALVFNVISLVTFLLAVFFLVNKGLHFSIEFTGGTLLEVNYAQAPDLDKLRMSFWRYNNRVQGLASSKLAIQQQVMEADMVIGAVLIPGASRGIGA